MVWLQQFPEHNVKPRKTLLFASSCSASWQLCSPAGQNLVEKHSTGSASKWSVRTCPSPDGAPVLCPPSRNRMKETLRLRSQSASLRLHESTSILSTQLPLALTFLPTYQHHFVRQFPTALDVAAAGFHAPYRCQTSTPSCE